MSALLWTAAEAAAATGGRLAGAWEGVRGISIDSRSLAPGDLFVALQGEARDGHAFVAKALEAGAGAALVSHRPEGVAADAPLLVVEDTLAGLEALARAARARSAARVLAVTGSVGKTTTKEMLRALLAPFGRVHAAEASFNNHWGVPLTLARMAPDADFAVLEIGMNHAGEIAPLSRLARPHVALITAVAEAHLGHFASVAEIADAKAEIFAGLEPGGTAVLPADNAHYARLEAAALAAGATLRRFGEGEAEFRLAAIDVLADATTVRSALGGDPWVFKIGAPGAHLASNALAALAAVEAAGVDPARAALVLARWEPPAGRGARWLVRLGPEGFDGSVRLLDESYNANPASVRAALAVLGAQPVEHGIGRVERGRRIAFLGDMLELGETELALHAALAEAPEMAAIDRVHCCGERMRALWEALPAGQRGAWVAESDALAERARRTVDAGDVCMVKGSKGARMGPVVEAIKALGEAVPAQKAGDGASERPGGGAGGAAGGGA